MRAALPAFFLCAVLTGCSTTPRAPEPRSVVMAAWPRPDQGCDFERPDRKRQWAIATSQDPGPAEPARGARFGSLGAAHTYWVLDVQFRQRPTAPGEVFCVSVVRYVSLFRPSNLAVIGLELTRPQEETLRLDLVHARVANPARRPQAPRPMQVDFALAAADYPNLTDDRVVRFDRIQARPDTGDVARQRRDIHWGAGVGILRVVAAVTESEPGADPPLVLDAAMHEALRSRNPLPP